MPHVLSLAYHFPPMGGAGVQRIVQLARRLPALGWDHSIVTGPRGAEARWAPLDGGAAYDVPANVLRLAGPEPRRSVGVRARGERWLRLESPWRRWWHEGALRLAREEANGVDLVHASIAPFDTAETAIAIARSLRVPLVVDLEDPWALDEMLVYPTRLHRRLELGRMRATLAAADAIVMNTSTAAARVRSRFPELADRRVHAIPNAFEPSDFDMSQRIRDDTAFRIVHTGSLHTDLGMRQRRAQIMRRALGGHVAGADHLARSLVFFLRALETAFDARPDIRARTELHLAGVLTSEDRHVIEGRAYVRAHGFMPHDNALALIRSADLLFLPLHDVQTGSRAGIVPQKTYEYLASGRMILGALPDGDARDLLAAAGNARLCRPRDVEAMAAIVAEEFDRRERGEKTPLPDPAVLARSDASTLAARLIGVFEAVLNGTYAASANAE